MMKGYLRLIVMKTLSDKRLSGYGLIKQIEKDTGSWKPSFGSVYPLLDKLLKEKLVEVRAEDRRKVYSLTGAGKKHLKLIDKIEMNFMLEIFNSLKKGQLPFKELNPELNEFRATVFEAYSTGKDRKKLKNILKETVKKIKSIK